MDHEPIARRRVALATAGPPPVDRRFPDLDRARRWQVHLDVLELFQPFGLIAGDWRGWRQWRQDREDHPGG